MLRESEVVATRDSAIDYRLPNEVPVPCRESRTSLRIGMFSPSSDDASAVGEIATRLGRRGYDVTMHGCAATHPAMHQVPNVAAPGSTLLAVLHALVTRRFDVWFFAGASMGHHAALARLSGRPVVMHVDARDAQRSERGPIARACLRSATRAAVRWCTHLVTGAEGTRADYRERVGRDSMVIACGADVERSTQPERIAACGVTPRNYYLIVSRLLPKHSLDVVLDGFRRSRTQRQLLIVGSAAGDGPFEARLRARASADDRIRLVGHVPDRTLLRELWCNCYAYLHGDSLGGTDPTLLRAMGHGSCVLALDTVCHREVLADTGRYFARTPDSVAALLDTIDLDPDQADRLRSRASTRIRERYTWEGATDRYAQLFQHAAVGVRQRPARASRAVHQRDW